MIQDFPNRWFLIKYPDYFKTALVYYYPLTIELVEKYKEHLNWYILSMGDTLPWSIDFMKQYKDWLCWGEGDKERDICWINNNEAIPWSIELIEAFKDKWQWGILSQNKVVATNDTIVAYFKDKLNLNHIEDIRKRNARIDSEPKTWWKPMKLTIEDYIKIMDPYDPNDFYHLCKNENLIWDMESFFLLEEKLNWECLSVNPALPWNEHLIEFFKDKWHWGSTNTPYFDFVNERMGICSNKGIYWNLKLIEKFEDKLNWPELSHNSSVEWSPTLVDKYACQVDWRGILDQEERLWEPYFAKYLNDTIVDEIFREILGWPSSCAPY